MADAADLNSAARKGVRVRIPAPAPPDECDVKSAVTVSATADLPAYQLPPIGLILLIVVAVLVVIYLARRRRR